MRLSLCHSSKSGWRVFGLFGRFMSVVHKAYSVVKLSPESNTSEVGHYAYVLASDSQNIDTWRLFQHVALLHALFLLCASLEESKTLFRGAVPNQEMNIYSKFRAINLEAA